MSKIRAITINTWNEQYQHDEHEHSTMIKTSAGTTSHETFMVIAWLCSLPPSPPDSVSGSPRDQSPLWSHRMTPQMVQPFSIKIIISNLCWPSCDLVRTVSHDRDAAIRINYDSAEFVHVHHTMEFFLRPKPPEPVPQDPWNQPRG